MFALGTHSVKPTSTEIKINGESRTPPEYDSYSGLVFIAQIIFQSSENFALVFGGTVDKYSEGTMTSYYIGADLFFSKEKFQPFVFVKGGYGYGKLENPLDKNDKITFTGPYFNGGIGTKFYIGSSWGLYGEGGYKYQGSSAAWDYTNEYGDKYELENTQKIGGLQFIAGIFLYP